MQGKARGGEEMCLEEVWDGRVHVDGRYGREGARLWERQSMTGGPSLLCLEEARAGEGARTMMYARGLRWRGA
eukprot:3905300-Rhodomonas_salina.1